MKKNPEYILSLTENERDLIGNALYLGSAIHENINHPYVADRMLKLAGRIANLQKQEVKNDD